jgi:coproporphyrinogen III oxidase
VSEPDVGAVRAYLLDLQDRITSGFEREDGEARFRCEQVETPGGGLSRPRVLDNGPVLEKAAASFSHSVGSRLSPASTERRPELAGRGFQAVSLSVIAHPRCPYAPTSHMNVRLFTAEREGAAPVWWFGGSFDLTPCYGFEEDAVAWHRAARDACAPLGEGAYAELKRQCDEYFNLPHRGEARGVGGIFFDDLERPDFARCFEFLRRVGEAYLSSYLAILSRRKHTPWGERERGFQRYRRGRYVEFNLLYDRGTRYGLESGRRIESVLASLPPDVAWRYDWSPEPGSPEAELYERFLPPRDWLAGSA